MNAIATVIPIAKATAAGCSPISDSRGMPCGAAATSRRMPTIAIASPATPPNAPNNSDSETNCASTRRVLAPSTTRSASSRWRPSARVRRRLAAFASAIANRSTPAAAAMSATLPKPPTMSSRIGRTTTLAFACLRKSANAIDGAMLG